jgi:hypothetical protein
VHFRALRMPALRREKTSVTLPNRGPAGVDQKITVPKAGKVQKEKQILWGFVRPMYVLSPT